MSGTKSHKLTCQECNSENVTFSDKRQAYVCIDCFYEFTFTSTGHSRIFISYARDDGEEFAKKIRYCLVEEHGLSVWQDRTEMQVGDAWRHQIESALRTGHVEYLILVMTPAAMTSEMVRKEWRSARQKGICVLPVKASPDLDIDSLPPWMSTTHFTDLSVPEEKERFIRILKGPCQVRPIPFMAGDLPGDYIPREHEFKQIVSGLLATRQEGPVAITAALQGAGGYGKTTLARTICHDKCIQEYFYDGILWVTPGENPGSLITYVEDLIRILCGEPSGSINLQGATVRLIELLADRHILMVIDDVWNSVHLRPFLQGGPHCVRLIATQNPDTVPDNATMVNVDAMEEHEATALLAAGLPPGHTPDMTRLAARLGKWPILLKLVNGVLRHRVYITGQGLAGALVYVNKALDKRGFTFFDDNDPVQRDQAVEKNIGVSLELLQPGECARFSELAVFPEDNDIPLDALEKLWNKTGGLDKLDTENLVDRLEQLSLLADFDRTARHIRLHDVIRNYLVQKQGDNLTQLHNQFLKAYSSDISGWTELPAKEPYLWNNLAYHLIKASREDELRQLLLDFNWLQAKLYATDVNSLITDYDQLPDDHALHLVERAIRISGHILAKDKSLLTDHFPGLLQSLWGPEIQSILEQARSNKKSTWLHPLSASSSQRSPQHGSVPLFVLKGHTGSVTAVAVTGDGARAVSASYDKTLKVWDMETGEHIRTMEGHTEWVRAVAVTSDGTWAISASDDLTLKVWDMETGEHIRTMEGHTEWVRAVVVTTDGTRAISASDDKTLKVWDLKTGEHIYTMEGHTGWVRAVAVTSDGARAISASDDKTLKIWDLGTGEHIRTMEGHTGSVSAVTVTNDGAKAISASNDNTLKVWDMGTGEHIRTMKGHTDWVRAVAVTSDGAKVISASDDRTLKVWDLEIGEHIHTMEGHTDWVTAVAVTNDGARAISASDDQTLKVWELKKLGF